MVRKLALLAVIAVITQGRLYTMEDLQAAIATYKAHYEGFIYDRITMMAARRIVKNTVVGD